MKVEQIAQDWMDSCCKSVQQYDHPAHMNLISKQVQVLGVPGFESLGYEDWHSQSEYEFKQKFIAKTDYQGLEIRHSDDQQIKFLTQETIHTTDGTVDSHPIEIVLSQEADGAWRVTQERLLSKEEASHLEKS